MKYIKNRKHINESIISTIGGGLLLGSGIGMLFNIGIKYLSKKKDIELVMSILKNLKSSTGFISEIDNEFINLYRYNYTNKILCFKLNTKSNEITYILDDTTLYFEHELTIKLNDKDFNNIKDCVTYMCGINEEIVNSFQELIDEGVKCNISDYNFIKRTFTITFTNFNIEYKDILFHCLDKFCLLYNSVVINNDSPAFIINSDSDCRYEINKDMGLLGEHIELTNMKTICVRIKSL